MRLYVGNLSYATTEDTLREKFSNYGEVVSVQIMKDRFTEQSKGFGFVEMADDIMGERGIGGMNGKDVDGRRIRVSVAVDKPKREGGARKFFKRDDERRDSDERQNFSRNRNDRNFERKTEKKHFDREHPEEY
ncbi:MAG: RNA-binding protein [Treponema sp.]|nr:RNA-binding protein [Treponema sp.]